MINNNDLVYFLMNGYVLNERVLDKEEKKKGYTFSIEGLGECDGNHVIDSTQIHRTIFLSEEEALQYKDIPQMYIGSSC